MTQRSLSSCVLVLLLTCCGWGSGAVGEGARDSGFVESLTFLSGLTSRVPGYAGNRQAADYVYEQFRQAGLQELTREGIEVTVPVDHGAVLESIDGGRLALSCVWPNLTRTSSTSPEGISGKLVYARDGGYECYNGLSKAELQGAVVVLEFNTAANWLKAADLGAAAIVFIEPEETMRREAEKKTADVPVDVPRYLLSREHRDELMRLVGQRVTVKGRMTWEKAESWNIFGFIPGADEELAEELVVLSAYYDSISIVPAKAPGADAAVGIGALIELAHSLAAQPPARSVLLLATSAHFMGLRGIDVFVQRHCRQIKPFTDVTYRLEHRQFDADAFRKLLTAHGLRDEALLAPFMTEHELWTEGGLQRFLEENGRLGDVPLSDYLVDQGVFYKPFEVSLFLGLDLSGHGDAVGIVHQGNFIHINEFYYQRHFAPFGKRFEAYSESVAEAMGVEPERLFANAITPKKGVGWISYLPDSVAFDAEVVLKAGMPALTLATVNDFRSNIDTTLDTLDRLDLAGSQEQVAFLQPLVRAALNDADLFPTSKMVLKDELCTLDGRIVTFNPRKSYVPDDPVQGAVAVIRGTQPFYTGVRGHFFELTDEDGRFSISRTEKRKAEMEAYYHDADSGEITFAPDRGVNGDLNYPMEFSIDWRRKEHTVVLFPCVCTDMFDLIDPRYLTQLDTINVYDSTNAAPLAYGYSVVLRNYLIRTSDVCPLAVVFSKPGRRLKVGVSSGILGMRMLFLNSPAEAETRAKAEGAGFDVNSCRGLPHSSFLAATDMLSLNGFRMKQLALYGIANKRLETLHGNAAAAIKTAAEAATEKQWDKFIRFSRRALGIESRAYPDVKGTSNDVIKGIVFYMALLIPFAYFMERLLFGFADIKKQIMGAAGVFLGIYVIMRFVHPAFRISYSPEVILLGFVILTLSFVVLSIITGKFQDQMSKMKQKRAKVYQADVGRISASATAFSLGIANMKRRKLRTTLTAATLILLTFTVLSFTSVKTYLQYNQIPRPNKPLYDGLLIRDRVWYPLEASALGYIESEFIGATVAPRAWILSRRIEEPCHIRIRSVDNGSATFALGALGVSPQERTITHLDEHLSAGGWFTDSCEKSCILPRELAAQLGIEDRDVGTAAIRILGQTVTVKGILDTDAIRDLRDLDDEAMTPVNFVEMSTDTQRKLQAGDRQQMANVEGKSKLEEFTHLEYSSVVVMPYGLLRDLGGSIQSVAVRFESGVDIREKVRDFVSRLAVTLFAGVEDSVTVYSSLAMTSFSGVGNLVVPILIAALIVLNTMMGSVYERIREIGIYSSVGLAPIHIGALFIAEACVFAILGAIAGYLLGQVVAKVLTETGLLVGLTLNYSSLSAVCSTIIVMSVVVLSTAYPARKASQLAVPDVTRRWVLPDPAGDLWQFDFPFTISGKEILGLYVFFNDYFSSYEEESIGDFYTHGTAFTMFDHEKGRGYLVSFRCWLAPFDLGVSQEVQMKAVPTGDHGVYEIRVEIQRLSGETNTWKRLNRRFLNILRKQFLIWRTVDVGVKVEYREQGEKLFGLSEPGAGQRDE